MSRRMIGIGLLVMVTTVLAGAGEKPEGVSMSVYDFEMKDIDGKTVKLSTYKGKVLMIVNVASK